MILGKPELRPFRSKPQKLSEWLETATRGLVPSAQARIHAEIEAHFAEAVSVRLQKGARLAEAQAAALADLGDAADAARRFRREHLTIGDGKQVAGQADMQISMGLIWIVCFAYSFFPKYYPSPSVGLLLILEIFSLYLAVFLLVWRQPRVVTRRLLALLVSLAWLNVGSYLFLNELNHTSDRFLRVMGWGQVVIWVLWAIQLTYLGFNLRRKLSRTGEGDRPCGDSAAA
jgi:hypothetical protein